MCGRVQKLKQLALKLRPVVNWWVIVPKSASIIHLELRPSYFYRCFGLAYGQTKKKAGRFRSIREEINKFSIESTQILGRGVYEAYT